MNEDETLIMHRLHQFSDGYAARDIPAVLATFSRNLDATVVVGSSSDEPLLGLDAIRKRLMQEFRQQDHLRLHARWMNLNIVGTVAWITALSEAMSPLIETPLTSRLTAVLLKESDGWFIAHLHFSFPLLPVEGNRVQPMPEYTRASMERSAYEGKFPRRRIHTTNRMKG
ncbi:MAG: nuclear transport factor 2 family protein [Verrucomicrobia bacterium]|nr:nuclear transport factor 2 family protein [Verrucomicrobiota bacterium]